MSAFRPARIAGACAIAALLLFFACHLEAPSDADGIFSFPTLKDKIGEADHVTILLQDSSGNTLNVLFDGPVDSTTSFEGLKAPGYEGGKVFIHIEARKGEEVVYKTTRGYDPAKGGDQERKVEVAPPVKAQDSLRLQPDTLTLALRGPSGRFKVQYLPATTAHLLSWFTPDPGHFDLTPDGRLTARAEGMARVIVSSKAEPKVVDTAWVRIIAAVPVDSVRFEQRSLDLFVQGVAESLHVRISPPLAPPGIVFQIGDSSKVQLGGGVLEGLTEGETWVLAQSMESPHRRDSIPVTVFPSGQVDSVRLVKDSLRLYLHGESLSLEARLFPDSMTPRFAWKSEDEAVARVSAEGRVIPVGPGETQVVVRARADSTKLDRALILVKKDMPRLEVGGDTVVARGTVLTHLPHITQEYGLVTQFKWDMDGEGDFEDSSATPPSELSHVYAEAKTYIVRFYVRDSEGNDTVYLRRVKAVDGRVVQILSPRNGSFTKEETIPVTWSVDGEPQTTLERLRTGANPIVRTAQDSARNTYSDTVLVYLDQTAPPRPLVKGPRGPVNTLAPRWSWASGDTSKTPGGGMGIYRFRLDDPDLSAAVPTTDTFFTVPTNLSAGTHTLFVHERDEAGNWSPSGSHAVVIDTTAPAVPVLSVSPASPTNNPRPTWSWSGGEGDDLRYYRYKLDNADFRTGARDTTGTGFRPGLDLLEGLHTLYVQERDSAGNWSPTGSLMVIVDMTPPPAPTVAVGPALLTNDATPTWTWTTEATGAAQFRWRLDNPDLTTGVKEGTPKTFTPETALAEGLHTLYVQERDAAENWSASGSQSIRIDLTPPSPPRIDSTPYSPLNSLRPTWTWRSGTGGAKIYRVRVDTANLSGAAERTDSLFKPESNLGEGPHLLYVQERDSAGNWSLSATRELEVAIHGILGGSPVGMGVEPVLEISQSGVPYLAYIENGSPVVKRYLSGRWEQVGTASGLNRSGIMKIRLGINSQNVPYVAYVDSSGLLIIERISGFDWVEVGNYISIRNSDNFSIDFDVQGTPYLGFVNHDGKVTVQKLGNDGLWATIGESGFTNTVYSDFGVDDAGRIFVATGDFSNFEPKVFTWTGSSWNQVGQLGSMVSPWLPKIVVHSTGKIFVSYYAQESSGYIPIIATFENEAWRTLDANGVFSGLDRALPIAIDPNGTVYTCTDRVLRYFGLAWQPFGAPVEGFISDRGMAIGSSGVPHIISQGPVSTWISIIKTSFDP